MSNRDMAFEPIQDNESVTDYLNRLDVTISMEMLLDVPRELFDKLAVEFVAMSAQCHKDTGVPYEDAVVFLAGLFRMTDEARDSLLDRARLIRKNQEASATKRNKPLDM